MSTTSTVSEFPTLPIGRTEARATRLGMGCATLGDLWQKTSESEALATIAAAYAGGVRFFDTAPWYGLGKSELRLGAGLREFPDVTVATKVGRILQREGDQRWARVWKGGLGFGVTFDYTYDGVMRSFADSLQRLGRTEVDALAIHDLDLLYHETEEELTRRFAELSSGGGYRALQELVGAQATKAIGAGINRTGLIPRFLEEFELDYFLVAMPYTLLNQEGLEELELCQKRGVSVLIGAPFASGLLVSGTKAPAKYDYAEPPAAVLEKTARLEAVCDEFRVPLAAAALQFVRAHPAVVSVIPGPMNAAQATQNVALMQWKIPAEFWERVRQEALVDERAPVPAS